MTIPLLDYAPSTQNQRVAGYEVPGEEQRIIGTTETPLSESEKTGVIWAAYRQIFHEQQILTSNRQYSLESQLKADKITVRQFIRGLLLSEAFRQYNYEPNNNYRFVQICIQRLLGREVYGEPEKLAWSILLATKGLAGFIDAILNSEEYLNNFGNNIVPYQRRRILPQRTQGELPFARMPRYEADYRDKLIDLGYFRASPQAKSFDDGEPYYPPQPVLFAAKILTFTGATVIGLVIVAVALSAWGLISL
ncbi:MAG TPA: phycobilisome rod-core linker polypeptide [Xenococcaceae cyanobacterium]